MPARFRFAGFLKRGLDLFGERLRFAQQTLCAQRAPVRVAHLLDNILRYLAATLFGDVDVIRLLLRAVVAHAEIEHVPGEGGVGQQVLALFRGGRTQADDPVFDTDAGAAGIVVAPAVAGIGHQLRQHILLGDIQDAARQGGFPSSSGGSRGCIFSARAIGV